MTRLYYIILSSQAEGQFRRTQYLGKNLSSNKGKVQTNKDKGFFFGDPSCRSHKDEEKERRNDKEEARYGKRREVSHFNRTQECNNSQNQGAQDNY